MKECIGSMCIGEVKTIAEDDDTIVQQCPRCKTIYVYKRQR